MPRIPTSRVGRTAKFGGLVAGQGARWLGTRAANAVRTPERAEQARGEWALNVADELVTQLGQMKGAAMKVGQVLSTMDFDLVPEAEREHFKERLAALRDDVPAADFEQVRRVVETDLGAPLAEAFADFSVTPVAAASIGQVHRARTHDGRDVAVKVQYPGIAEAVETDLRNLNLLFPLVKRLAPGLDVKAIARELRDRIGEELDYEIEAQHQRTVARAFRNHPFVRIPEVDTRLSTRRVLVSEFVTGEGFAAVKARSEAQRDRFGEIMFRFFYGLLGRERLCAGDPHPGNYLLCADGRVCFLDFGLMRKVPEESWRASARSPARSPRATPRPSIAASRTWATSRTPARSSRRSCSSSCARPASGTSSRASAVWTPSTCATPSRSAAPRARPTSSRCAARRCRPRRCSSGAWRACSSACWASCGPARTGAPWPRSTSPARRPPRPWAVRRPPTTRHGRPEA